ncbi:MAG: hypothetical protein ACUVS7_14525 [Bryobacteraceae bacterium]
MEHWLRVEWPKGAAEPAQCWLSNLPPETSLGDLVRLARHRWSIERDYLEPKQELGLGHFEGRSWRRLHHYATLVTATSGFLVAKRSRFSLQRKRAGSSLPQVSRLRTIVRTAAGKQGRSCEKTSTAGIQRKITV